MKTLWMPGAHARRDLSGFVTNGVFRTLLGVVLHVNEDEAGTPLSFWGPGNQSSVVPNLQIFKDGSFDQMLPFDRQPWCQVNGNFNYAAIETAGTTGEKLTGAQLATIARAMLIWHTDYGVPLQIANKPGDRGLGIHSMGGAAWGGHPCPGTIRANQRQAALDLASGEGLSMSDIQKILDAVAELKADVDKMKADLIDTIDHPAFTQDYDGTHSKVRTMLARIGPSGYVEPPIPAGHGNPDKTDHVAGGAQ